MCKEGILTREHVSRKGQRHGGKPTAFYSIAEHGLDKIPKGWKHDGSPGSGAAGEMREHGGKSKGFAKVATLPPEERVPLSPIKGRPEPLPEAAIQRELAKDSTFARAMRVPGSPIGSTGAASVVSPAQKESVFRPEFGAAPDPKAAPPPAPPKVLDEPHIVIQGQDGPKRYPLSHAKALYRQLKEIFE